jgi:hypothetical protein
LFYKKISGQPNYPFSYKRNFYEEEKEEKSCATCFQANEFGFFSLRRINYNYLKTGIENYQ